jgi:hypothetical protein
MITRFLTDVRVSFNPFSLRAKPARLFLSLIPPNARAAGMKIESKMLPRTSKEPASLAVKFSTSTFVFLCGGLLLRDYEWLNDEEYLDIHVGIQELGSLAN